MDAVQRTNDDATQSKRSAVELGYWDDPYLKSMIPWNPGGGDRSSRKSPEIHLGYFTRVAGMWRLIEELVRYCQCHIFTNLVKRLQGV